MCANEGFWFEGFWFEGFWFEGFWFEGFWLEIQRYAYKIRALKRGKAGFRLIVFDQCDKLQDIRPAFDASRCTLATWKVKFNGVL
jgi:hypothetical protein